jgi:hypothetical protein
MVWLHLLCFKYSIVASEWVASDRNLIKNRGKEYRNQTVFFGPLNIVHQLAQLPTTQHKHPETFLMDCWQMSPVGGLPQLYIHCHGEFTEGTLLF